MAHARARDPRGEGFLAWSCCLYCGSAQRPNQHKPHCNSWLCTNLWAWPQETSTRCITELAMQIFSDNLQSLCQVIKNMGLIPALDPAMAWSSSHSLILWASRQLYVAPLVKTPWKDLCQSRTAMWHTGPPHSLLTHDTPLMPKWQAAEGEKGGVCVCGVWVWQLWYRCPSRQFIFSAGHLPLDYSPFAVPQPHKGAISQLENLAL